MITHLMFVPKLMDLCRELICWSHRQQRSCCPCRQQIHCRCRQQMCCLFREEKKCVHTQQKLRRCNTRVLWPTSKVYLRQQLRGGRGVAAAPGRRPCGGGRSRRHDVPGPGAAALRPAGARRHQLRAARACIYYVTCSTAEADWSKRIREMQYADYEDHTVGS